MRESFDRKFKQRVFYPNALWEKQGKYSIFVLKKHALENGNHMSRSSLDTYFRL